MYMNIRTINKLRSVKVAYKMSIGTITGTFVKQNKLIELKSKFSNFYKK